MPADGAVGQEAGEGLDLGQLGHDPIVPGRADERRGVVPAVDDGGGPPGRH